MRLIFDKISFKIILGISMSIIIFGFIAGAVGNDTTREPTELSQNTWDGSLGVDSDLTSSVDDSTFTDGGYSGFLFGGGATDLFGSNGLISDLTYGIGEMRGSMSNAPGVVRGMMAIIPIAIVLVVIRSIDISM